MSNPYEISIEKAEELLYAVLGPYEYEVIEHPAYFWHVFLQDLEPIDVSGSLAINEAVYEYQGREYCCLWAIDSKNDDPFQVSIRTIRPKPKRHPVDNFDDENSG